jgi:hypothetical protein
MVEDIGQPIGGEHVRPRIGSAACGGSQLLCHDATLVVVVPEHVANLVLDHRVQVHPVLFPLVPGRWDSESLRGVGSTSQPHPAASSSMVPIPN